MFRRRWSGLPPDPIFASDLSELGYFINDEDEIRSLTNPDNYFKFFVSKNERWNERQLFHMNEAIGNVIHARLEAEGLEKILLPLGTTDTSKPHVVIRASSDMGNKARVVVVLGQSVQDFGVLAHRVIGGRGGINKGSIISLVQGLKQQRASATDSSAPGILIANPGELYWWPEGQRSLSPSARHAIPMSSSVHLGRYYDPVKNGIPENATPAEHVQHIFDKVVPALVPAAARLDVIAVGDVAEEVEDYLNDDAVWARLGSRMNSLVVLGGFYHSDRFKCDGFKTFMKDQARAYAMHHEPLDTPFTGPGGNPQAAGFTAYGCPAFSAGDANVTETILIEAQAAVLKWSQEVALAGA
ncbi:Arb2 domain-containing protein [Podospora didyma]|uniref:Arb2 domain-containing protein n=1 Tax=Podospora didyma TaxID=330526 RepID=A0AAE0K880_9PEZI|nr:Arb2 domain-containing protein [Podospora didyma]